MGDGRYRWRHDQVLKVIANEVTKAMKARKIEADQFRKSRREDTEKEERENEPVIFSGRLAVVSGSGDSA